MWPVFFFGTQSRRSRKKGERARDRYRTHWGSEGNPLYFPSVVSQSCQFPCVKRKCERPTYRTPTVNWSGRELQEYSLHFSYWLVLSSLLRTVTNFVTDRGSCMSQWLSTIIVYYCHEEWTGDETRVERGRRERDKPRTGTIMVLQTEGGRGISTITPQTTKSSTTTTRVERAESFSSNLIPFSLRRGIIYIGELIPRIFLVHKERHSEV